jgi:hypothetical protein
MKRFNPRLRPLYISQNYKNEEFSFTKGDFMGTFAYWVVLQSPYDAPDITDALRAFDSHLAVCGVDRDIPKKFTYQELEKIISAEAFSGLPDIALLGEPRISSGEGYENRHSEPHPNYSAIGLSALARNVFLCY